MDEFSIRCRCGTEIHTSSAHVGRTIRCRCGQSLTIARPSTAPNAARKTARSGRQRAGRPRPRRWFTKLIAVLGRAGRGIAAELRSTRPITRWSARLQVVYAAAVIAAWLMLITLSERWLPATLLAYGPRGVVLVPLVLVLPAGVLFSRRTLIFPAFAMWLAVSQIMGFRMSLTSAEPPLRLAIGEAPVVRVVTLNTAGGRAGSNNLSALIALYDPDVIALQECPHQLPDSLAAIGVWHTATNGRLCTLSRWPVGRSDSMPRAQFTRVRELGFGGSALVSRVEILHPERPFSLVNLHLETARKGLGGMLGPDGLIPDEGGLPSAIRFLRNGDRADANALIRRSESRRASEWAARDAGTTPVVVVGDFNLPVESTIYRESWRSWLNAFDSSGRGFGYTKSEGSLLRIRIDHVLASPEWFRETARGSDRRWGRITGL